MRLKFVKSPINKSSDGIIIHIEKESDIEKIGHYRKTKNQRFLSVFFELDPNHKKASSYLFFVEYAFEYWIDKFIDEAKLKGSNLRLIKPDLMPEKSYIWAKIKNMLLRLLNTKNYHMYIHV